MISRFYRISIVALLLCAPALADQISRIETARTVEPARVLTEELNSRLMGRKMPYRIILPVEYNSVSSSGRRYPVLYLLHGLSGHFDNWTTRSDVVEHSAYYDLIIVTPEGENGWYTDNLTKDGDKYESYIIRELIPEIDKRYRTLDHQRAIAGLSMGGYGAIKFGLKYPEMFDIAGSFSGALRAASITEKEIPGAIGRTINTIFGPLGSEIRKANDLFDLVRRATPEKIKNLPFLYLDCGTEDLLFQNSRDFVDLLLEKRIPHEFRHRPGGHNWDYWNSQVEEFLQLAGKQMGVTRSR